MTFIMILCALGCFILIFFSGYGVIYFTENAPEDKPHYQFVIKQFAAGTWTFGLLFVMSMVMAGIAYERSGDDEPMITVTPNDEDV